jgi:uncharacterized membrane protein YoaK (UPF0700 family)
MEIARLEILLDFAIVLSFFIAGAMLSGLLINGRVHRKKHPLYSVPLILVGLLTVGIGLTGHLGFFGPFGGSVDQLRDFVFLSILSFASGLQNAAVATSTGLLVRTTHLTGPATDLGIHLAELFFTEGEHRRTVSQHALLRTGKIIAFATGASTGVVLAHRFQYLALLVPSVSIFLATLLSFRPLTLYSTRVMTNETEKRSA